MSILNKLRDHLREAACCALPDDFEAAMVEAGVPRDLLLSWQGGGEHDDTIGQFFAPSLVEVLNSLLIQDSEQALVFVQDEAGETVGLTLVPKAEYVKLKQKSDVEPCFVVKGR